MTHDHDYTGLQRAILDVLRERHVPGAVWYYAPSRSKRSEREIATIKRLGLTVGVADIAISLPGNRMAFLVASDAEHPVSDDQKSFLTGVAANGHQAAVVYSIEQAINYLRNWGAIRDGVKVSA